MSGSRLMLFPKAKNYLGGMRDKPSVEVGKVVCFPLAGVGDKVYNMRGREVQGGINQSLLQFRYDLKVAPFDAVHYGAHPKWKAFTV
jgi:hypothetical protein